MNKFQIVISDTDNIIKKIYDSVPIHQIIKFEYLYMLTKRNNIDNNLHIIYHNPFAIIEIFERHFFEKYSPTDNSELYNAWLYLQPNIYCNDLFDPEDKASSIFDILDKFSKKEINLILRDNSDFDKFLKYSSKNVVRKLIEFCDVIGLKNYINTENLLVYILKRFSGRDLRNANIRVPLNYIGHDKICPEHHPNLWWAWNVTKKNTSELLRVYPIISEYCIYTVAYYIYDVSDKVKNLIFQGKNCQKIISIITSFGKIKIELENYVEPYLEKGCCGISDLNQETLEYIYNKTDNFELATNIFEYFCENKVVLLDKMMLRKLNIPNIDCAFNYFIFIETNIDKLNLDKEYIISCIEKGHYMFSLFLNNIHDLPPNFFLAVNIMDEFFGTNKLIRHEDDDDYYSHKKAYSRNYFLNERIDNPEDYDDNYMFLEVEKKIYVTSYNKIITQGVLSYYQKLRVVPDFPLIDILIKDLDNLQFSIDEIVAVKNKLYFGSNGYIQILDTCYISFCVLFMNICIAFFSNSEEEKIVLCVNNKIKIYNSRYMFDGLLGENLLFYNILYKIQNN